MVAAAQIGSEDDIELSGEDDNLFPRGDVAAYLEEMAEVQERLLYINSRQCLRESQTGGYTLKEIERASRKAEVEAELPRSNNQRLTPKQVMEIRRMRADGLTLCEIGERYNITNQYVSNICMGHSWKNLPLISFKAGVS